MPRGSLSKIEVCLLKKPFMYVFFCKFDIRPDCVVAAVSSVAVALSINSFGMTLEPCNFSIVSLTLARPLSILVREGICEMVD